MQFGALDYATDTLMKPLPPDAVKLPAEFTIPAHSLQMMALEDMDAHADRVGFVNGYPAGIKGDQAFLVHCYGMVGAARDDAPNSSNATELYVMIGQPARHIDRQISVVGRVVHGIEQLSSLPRGTGAMGFFEAGGHPLDIQSTAWDQICQKAHSFVLERSIPILSLLRNWSMHAATCKETGSPRQYLAGWASVMCARPSK